MHSPEIREDDAATPVTITVKKLDGKAPTSARPTPLHVHGGTGSRAILQFIVISSHHSPLLYTWRPETGRMCVYAFFVLSGLVSALAGTELNIPGKPDKGRPPKLWLRSSFGGWLLECGRYNINLIVRRCLPLLVFGVVLTGFYLLVKSIPPAPIPTWDFITSTWAFHGYTRMHWWEVTPNGWFISALIWYILFLPSVLIVLRGIFRHRIVRSLFIIPAIGFCAWQNWTQFLFMRYFSPYPFLGWMIVSYCLGALLTDHYPRVIKWFTNKSLLIRLPIELLSWASVLYFAYQPESRILSTTNQLAFFLLCLFRPTVARMLDCRWFQSVASGTIPLLAFLTHGIVALQILGLLQSYPNLTVWNCYYITWLVSIAFEIHLMQPLVTATKKHFTV